MTAPNRRSGGDQDENQVNGRGSVRRNARRIVDTSSNIDDFYEERKGSPSKAEKTHN